MPHVITRDDYERHRISPPWPERWRHAALVKALSKFDESFLLTFEMEEIGKSVEGRSIYEARVGSGPKRVLLWSQMHGDEPTHTAVLMDLLSFLLTEPTHPVAQAVLSQCRLHMIVMLNPDGAERDNRRNAQDIDINRDARDLQTPEGRILWAAVQRVRPQFAFNLHDHNVRATAGIERRPATVALLAPPINQANTEVENIRRAKQLVVTFAEAVKDECPGMVARYNADYMARAFGEAVQKFGAATVLVEAGGWSSVDSTPLVEAHFLGTVRTLHAIATDEYLRADSAAYDKLPLSGGRELFDLMIAGVQVVNGLGQPSFKADIGVNYVDYRGPERGSRTARIADVGDLRVTTGKDRVDGDGLQCVPGLLAYRPGITPTHLPNDVEFEDLLASGVTTLIGSVDLGDENDVLEFTKMESDKSPIHLGFVGDASSFQSADREQSLGRLLRAVGHGLLAVAKETLPAEFGKCCQWFRVPLVPREELMQFDPSNVTLSPDYLHRMRQMYERLDLTGRGEIRLGATADLSLFLAIEERPARKPGYVLIGGNFVFKDGKALPKPVGKVLRRS